MKKVTTTTLRKNIKPVEIINFAVKFRNDMARLNDDLRGRLSALNTFTPFRSKYKLPEPLPRVFTAYTSLFHLCLRRKARITLAYFFIAALAVLSNIFALLSMTNFLWREQNASVSGTIFVQPGKSQWNFMVIHSLSPSKFLYLSLY
jgi:hypothetical protein